MLQLSLKLNIHVLNNSYYLYKLVEFYILLCNISSFFSAISVADRTVEVAFENGSKGSYNVGEDIKLMCNATDQGGIYVSFVMSW